MGLNSNYGVDILTKERLEEILNDPNGNNAGLWGPVIEKNGMYYLTLRKSLEELEKEGISYLDMLDATVDNTEFDPKYYVISEVVSKSTTPEEAKKIIHNGSYKYPSSNCDVSNVDGYIKEVEHVMKKEVGRIEINEDGSINIYDIDGNEVIKGTKITKNTDPNADNKYDLSDIEKVVSPETYNLEDKLDSGNKELIEGYLNNLTDLNDIELVLNENGEYVADINGKKIVFDKDSTLIDAVEKISYEFQNDKSLQDFLKSNKTNRLRKKINPQRIFIDVNSFESAISTYAGVKDILNSASGKYNPGCLTDKLSSAYGSLVSGSSPVTKISQAANLVSSLTTNIRYSLKAYENIDHNLSFIINSIISEIFANNNFRDEDTKAFYDSDLDARTQLLADTIDRLTNTFNALKKEYESKYPNDSVWFDENISRLLMGVGNAFHFVDLGTDKLSTGSSNGQCGASISTITDTVEFIQKNNLIDILKLYSNGSSFKDSGLESVYVKRFSLEEGSIPYGHAEYTFLNDYVTFQSKDINVIGAGDFHQLIYYNADAIKNIKSYMKSQLSQFDAISLTVSDEETGKNTTLKGFEILKYYAFNAKQYQDDMSIVNQQKYNYKQYQKIMPYEADMNGDLYLEYLVQDWSKIDVVNECPELDGKIQYMSQKELALYFMYRGVPLDNAVHGDIKNTKVNIDDANGYLDAMSDLINQRQGLEDALLRYESYFKYLKNGGIGGIIPFLETAMEGYTDGKNKFLENVIRGLTFSADGVKSASDYRDTFLLSLLSENSGSDDLDGLCKSLGIGELDTNLKSLLKRNYSVFKSVGTMIIPTLVTFTPGVPKAVSVGISRGLVALNTIGSTSQAAMMMQLQQNGETDAVKAYTYSFLSAGSTLLMNRYLSGIAGLNGSMKLPANAQEFLSSMVMQGGRATAGVYTDTVLRAAILGQPIDISGLPSANYEAIIDGMLTAGLLNGITMMSFKLADKVVINFSDKYTSYKDFMSDVEKQYYESKEILKSRILKAIGQEKTDLAIVDSDKLPDATFDATMLGKWLKERDNPNKDALLDLTDRAASVIGSSLRKGHHLVMDPNRNTYYIFDSETGSTLVVPKEWISTHEPGPINPGYDYYSTGSSKPGRLTGVTLGENGLVLLDKPEFEMSQNKLWKNYTAEEFNKTFKSVERDGVVYYVASGEDFNFLVHVVQTRGETKGNGSTNDDQKKIRYLIDHIKDNPELFVLNDLGISNTLGLYTPTLSASTISSNNLSTFGGSFRTSGGLSDTAPLIVGLNENNINNVYQYTSTDGSTPRTTNPIGYDESVFELGKDRTNPFYDEVVLKRSGQMPKYIVTPYPPGDSRNKTNIEWAKAYGVPIVYIDIEAYGARFQNEAHSIIDKYRDDECISYSDICELEKLYTKTGNLLPPTKNHDPVGETGLNILRQYTAISKNPSAENINKLMEIDKEFGNAGFYNVFIYGAVHGDASSGVFDAVIKAYDLRAKYPGLSRDEIANELIKAAHGTKSFSGVLRNFDIELKKLDQYAKTIVDSNKSLPQDKIIIGDTVQNNNSATIVPLNTLLQKNANVITDKDNVPRVKMPDEIKPEDLILVRSTDVLPSGNVVTTPQAGGSDGSKAKPVVYGDQDLYPSTDNRHTIHWAFNGFVKGNFQGAGDWENNPFVLLEPYKYHTGDSQPGGFSSDFSLDHDTKLYEPLLLVDSKWYNQNGDAELKKLGIDYKIIDGDKGTCVANVLSELGYPVNDTTVDVPTNPGPQKEFEDQVDLILKENGAKNVGIRPFGGIYDIYNSSMNRNEAVLEYARGTNVNLGQKNVPISNAEFLAIIDYDGKTLNPTTGEIDTTKFRLSQIEEKFSDPDFQEKSAKTTLARQMADQGIRYDVEKKTFYIQDYDSYIKANRTTLDPNSAEMEAAYNAFVKTCYKQYINLMREK